MYPEDYCNAVTQLGTLRNVLWLGILRNVPWLRASCSMYLSWARRAMYSEEYVAM
jgi:hypothetical protein